MSWSFSVTENTKADALRVFDNSLADNQAYIPDNVRGQLSDAARVLADALPSSGNKVTVSTAGHVERDGKSGNVSLSMYFTAADADIPNVRKAEDGGAEKAEKGPQAAQDAPRGPTRPVDGYPKVTQAEANASGDPGAANASYDSGPEPTAPSTDGVESLAELPRRS